MRRFQAFAGGVCSVLVSTGAYAADPILVAEPVDYVRVCDAFGSGFIYIPGSQTCLQISGYVLSEAAWVGSAGIGEETYYTTLDFVGGDELIRFGVTTNANDPRRPVNQFGSNWGPGNIFTVPTLSANLGGNFVDDVNVSSDAFNNFTTRARGQVNFDARTHTDLGILRSYVALRGTIGHEAVTDDFTLEDAFLTLETDNSIFTAGLIATFFDFFGGYSLDSRVGGDDPSDEVNLLGYTQKLGNGFTASISLEDRRIRQEDLAFDPISLTPSGIVTLAQQSLGLPAGQFGGQVPFVTGFTYDGQEVPDLVVALELQKTWGSAQVMAAARQVNGGFDGSDVITGSALASAFGFPENLSNDVLQVLGVPEYPGFSDQKLGWAVGAGLTINIPNPKIAASIQGTYAEGMPGYVTTGNGGSLSDALIVGTYDLGCDFGGDPACSASTSYDLQLTKAWSVVAGMEIDLTKTVQFRLNGTYADFDHAGVYFDYDSWTSAATLVWTPVTNLTIGGEIAYERVDGDIYVAGQDPAISLPVPVGVGDGDIWGALFQVELAF